MTVAAPCQVHRWFVPAGDDGIALASCFNCRVQQYQPTDGTRESAIRANEMNEANKYPLLTVSSKRDYSTIKHAGDLKPPEEVRMVQNTGSPRIVQNTNSPQAENSIDKRKGQGHLSNFTKNRGARERYDAIAQQVIDDAVRLGSWIASCRLHNIPTGSVTGLVRHWRKHGLAIPLVKHIKKAATIARRKSPQSAPVSPNQPQRAPSSTTPTPSSTTLPSWNEAWGDNVKIEWLKTLALVGKN